MSSDLTELGQEAIAAVSRGVSDGPSRQMPTARVCIL
jgi:hypothetical protein